MEISRADGLILSDDRGRLDRSRVLAWLRASYWASDRTADVLERSIEHSVAWGVYAPDGEQVAFFRTVTDFATFAWFCDVWVDEEWRGRGVGRWMIDAAVEWLDESGVRRFVLATLDAHGVYASVGFEPLAHPERWMIIDRRAIIP